VEPPLERRDNFKGLLIPKATRHPTFIPFQQKVLLGFGKDMAPILDNMPDDGCKFDHVSNGFQRIKDLQEQHKSYTTRADKLAFLHRLVLSTNQKVEAIKNEMQFEDRPGKKANNSAARSTNSPEELKEKGVLVLQSTPATADSIKQARTRPRRGTISNGSSTNSLNSPTQSPNVSTFNVLAHSASGGSEGMISPPLSPTGTPPLSPTSSFPLPTAGSFPVSVPNPYIEKLKKG